MIDDAQRHPITAILCIGAIAAFAAELSGRSIDHMALIAPLVLAEPWRFITTIFPHANWIHILFNLMWIWQLGRALESRMGMGSFLALALISAVSGSALQLVFGGVPIGLSGVVYGLAAFAWARGRHDRAYAGLIDESTRNLLIVWFFICIGFTWLNVLQIANAGHAGGAIIGLALGSGRPWIAPLILTMLGTAVLFRGSVPIRDPNAWQWYNEGVREYQEGNYERALDLFQEACRRDRSAAAAWFNVGVTQQRLGANAESNRAFLEAARLDLGLFDDAAEREQWKRLIEDQDGSLKPTSDTGQ